MSQGAGVALVGVLVAALLAAMWLAWRRQERRSLVALPALPAGPVLGAPTLGPVEVTYLATAPADQPLARVTAHRLAVRAPGDVAVHDSGVLLRRAGAADLFLPAADLRWVGVTSGVAGTAVGVDRAVVVRWTCGTMTLDTGVLPRRAADAGPLADAARALVGTHPDDGSTR